MTIGPPHFEAALFPLTTVRAGLAPMGKARGIESKLVRLAALRKEPPSPEHTDELRKALADPSNFVVEAAAEAINLENGAGLVPDLLTAFDRFLIDPLTSDKRCLAKIAILDALNRLEYMDATVFRTHVRYVQLESVWGAPKPEDRAADLRAACAFGLVRTDTMRSLPLLADLLADSEKSTRVAAATALAGTMQTAAVPLLRLKARLGDKEPEVTSACFTSLLAFGWEEAIPFIADFLKGSDDVATMACVALGESRRPEAFAHLTRFWPTCSSRIRADVLIAISLLRLPEATAFLLALIPGPADTAALAVEALAVHAHNPQVRQQTQAAVDATGNRELQKVWVSRFDRK